jgi:phosphatidylinositol alpha-1,6-mannosyltransferase
MKGRALWQTYRLARRVVAISRYTRGLLREGGVPSGKIVLVRPGTDPTTFRPAGRDPALVRELGLEGRRVVLTVGRLTWRKGQDRMLEALPAIAQAAPNVTYLLAGTGPLEPELRALARRLGLEDRVRLLGEVADEALPRLYNVADVFVMANRVSAGTRDVEGFGIVFLEANACEVPVVGGRSGGVIDAVEDGLTGLLVDAESPEEIARAVVRLLEDSALARRMGVEGRRRVERELTWDHTARGVGRVLTELSEAGAGGAVDSLRSGPRDDGDRHAD